MNRIHGIALLLLFGIPCAPAQVTDDPLPSAPPLPAPADPAPGAVPAAPEPAAELLEITGTRQIVDQMKQRILQSQLQVLEQHGLPTAETPATQAFLQQLEEFMSPHLSWQQLEPEFVHLYNSVFTPEEITGLIGFYRSPLGDKILRKMPELLQQTATLTHARAQAVSPDIQKITQEFIASQQTPRLAPPTPTSEPSAPSPTAPEQQTPAPPPPLEL